MAKKSRYTGLGKAFKKKGHKGTFKKGTWIRYKYKNGRRVGAVKSTRR